MDFLKNFSEVALGFVVELLKLMPIMIFIFGFKLQPLKRIVIFGLCAVILLTLLTNFGLNLQMPIYTYVSLLLTMFITRGKNRIIYALISSLGISILDMLIATVWLFFNDQTYSQVADNTASRIIINTINIVTVFGICIIGRIFLSQQQYISLQKARRSYLIFFLLGEISLSIFMTVFQISNNSNDKTEKAMAVCLSVGSIIFLLTAFISLINHISKEHFKSFSEINEKLIQSQERYYTMLLQKEEETRKFRHDINNHLNCMRILFNEKRYNELEKYFDNMGVSVQNLRSELQIGNDLISAILKDESDKHTDVSVDIVGKIPPVLRLDNMDICTIFYNLFDNAFTAAECSEKKSVGISVRLLGKNLFFTIKNTISHKIEIVDNILITEKDDTRHHGFGSGNAANCAERNGGKLIYECSDTHFVAELILPNIDSFYSKRHI